MILALYYGYCFLSGLALGILTTERGWRPVPSCLGLVTINVLVGVLLSSLGLI